MNQENSKKIEKFLWEHPNTHFLQSIPWTKVKENWEKEFITIQENGKIMGTMSILLKKVPLLNRYMMYAPRGFVCDYHDEETLRKLTQKVTEIAEQYKAFVFKMDPAVADHDEKFKSIMQRLGYKITNAPTIQPQYVMRLNIKKKKEEEILKSFHEKTRYNIRLSNKKGVTIREGKREDLIAFYDIMKQTGKRDKFFIRNIAYFQKIYDIMYPKYTKLLIAEYNHIPIAAAMPILYGNKVWYLYGGSTNTYRNKMPNYLLQWEMIQWAIKNGCDIYDFRGVTGYENAESPQYGVYRFKKGFGGEVVKFVGEMEKVFSPTIYAIWKIMFACYKKLSYRIDKIKEIFKIGK